VKESEANAQRKSIISALRAAAPKWEFEQMNFVVGNCNEIMQRQWCAGAGHHQGLGGCEHTSSGKAK